MSLLCRQCDEPIDGGYSIIIFTGNTKTGLIDPNKSPIRLIVCSWHVERLVGTFKKSINECDGLVFAIATLNNAAQGKNFNGALSIDQAEELKDAVFNLDDVLYLTDEEMKKYFYTPFNSLLSEAQKWMGRDDLSFYCTALNRYIDDLADHKHRQEEEISASRQRKIDERIKLRVNYSELINTAMAQAEKNRAVSREIIEQLHEADVLEPSTSFRHYSLFPGECKILEVKDEETNFFANLGFDRDLALISIDKRLPVNQQLYRREDEWVEVR